MSSTTTGVQKRSALDSALESLRLDGAIFFRSEFTEPWAYESRPPALIAAALHPGADRVIMFHIVARGRCWIDIGDGSPQWAQTGDLIVMPYGAQHTVGGTDRAEPVPIASLVGYPPWERLPVLQYGGGGERTDIVCGYLHSTHPLFEPSLNALPPLLVVTLPEEPAAQWVRSSIEYAVTMSQAALPA
ncbi:MAG: cupin domain-containing protein, partial [Marmoricola sp.]